MHLVTNFLISISSHWEYFATIFSILFNDKGLHILAFATKSKIGFGQLAVYKILKRYKLPVGSLTRDAIKI